MRFWLLGALTLALPATAVATQIFHTDAGAASIVSMEFHPSCSPGGCGGTPEAGIVRTLVDTSQTLDYEISLAVESVTGEVTDGLLTILSTNTILLHNFAISNNNGRIIVDFSGVSFSFSADATGDVTGALDDGGLRIPSAGSIMLKRDIQAYNIAPGPAIIPFTGEIDLTGGQLTIDPITFRFDGVGSTAFIDLELKLIRLYADPRNPPPRCSWPRASRRWRWGGGG